MTYTEEAIKLIDKQIEKLIEAKNLLRGIESIPTYGRARNFTPKTVKDSEYTKRVISPEARKKIAAAQKKRWAAKKAPKPSPPPSSNNKVAAVEAQIATIKAEESPKTFSAPSTAPKQGV